jgi:hypothetical protein
MVAMSSQTPYEKPWSCKGKAELIFLPILTAGQFACLFAAVRPCLCRARSGLITNDLAGIEPRGA